MKSRRLIQIRKRNGLSSITTKSGKITPRLFKQEAKDYDSDGELVGEYPQPTFPGARQFITPMKKNNSGEWYWGGTIEDLTRIIQKAKLREFLGKDRGFPKYGQLIEPGDVEARLSDDQDPFFTHPELWKSVMLEGGRANLDIDNNPIHEAIYLCSIDNPIFKSNLSDAKNKYVRAGWVYEIVEADIETKKKADDIDKEIQATLFLANMKNDEEKMRTIAKIMGIPGYSDSLSPAALFVLLKDAAVSNTKTATKFGSQTTWQDKFIELADPEITPTSVLEVMGQVEDGLSMRRITPNGRGGYQMNGEDLEGVRNKTQLIDFFRNTDNQEFYIQLLKYLEDVEKQRAGSSS